MKKKYNEVEVKNNMEVESENSMDNNGEEVAPKEKKQLQKLVDVQPKKVKRGLLSRLVTGVIGPEGLPGIGTYVNEEIVKPAVKNIIFDAINSAARMALFRDGGGPSNHRSYGQGYNRRPSDYRPATNYSNRYANTPQQPEPRERNVARAARHGVEEYIIEDRFDASHVLTTLTENADMYDSVSVADYYDLIGVPSQYTDNTYGWTIDSITRATIVPVRGGYIIKFPPVEVI